MPEYKHKLIGITSYLSGITGLVIDGCNSGPSNFRKIYGQEWAGPITNHVGDIVWGCAAVHIGYYLGRALKPIVGEKAADRAAKIAIAGLFTTVIICELAGFYNTPDILDAPGAMLGLLYGASNIEIYNSHARTI